MLICGLNKEIELKEMANNTPVNVFEVMVEAQYGAGEPDMNLIIYSQEDFKERIPFIKCIQKDGDVRSIKKYICDNPQYREIFEKYLEELDEWAVDSEYERFYIESISFVDENGKYNEVQFKNN